MLRNTPGAMIDNGLIVRFGLANGPDQLEGDPEQAAVPAIAEKHADDRQFAE